MMQTQATGQQRDNQVSQVSEQKEIQILHQGFQHPLRNGKKSAGSHFLV